VEIVRGLPAVRDAALHGVLLHVVVTSAVESVSVIVAALESRGIQVHGTERIVPSLEDVFVSLIDAESRSELRTQLHA